MVKVQVTGLSVPSAHVLNPLNWQTVRLLRENAATASAGGYLLGPPSMVGANTLWGLPVVLSIGMTANTAVVADWSMATMALYDREQTTVRTGYINDDFTRNIVRLLAEMRAAFAIFRPSAICKVTGLS
jgi:HK97 family phage major capsid protein